MLLAREDEAVKREAATLAQQAVAAILSAADEEAPVREFEDLAWAAALNLGWALMATALGARCARATEKDMEEERGLSKEQGALRMDRDYWGTLKTTLGPMRFPWFSYRDRSVGTASVTRTPAKQTVLPLFRHCRSSELLLEWESDGR